MINSLTISPLFGILLTCGSYVLGVKIQEKLKHPLANPMILATVFCIAFLLIFDIPLENYRIGSSYVSLFLGPATASLALSIYRQYPVLKKNLLPVLAGTAVGSAVSMSSVLLLCKLFRLEEVWAQSLLSKSVTTAIAIEITAQQGGLPSITVAAVLITGLLGAVFAPLLIRLLRVQDPVAAGLAIGTASHALGTSKALQIGEVEAAMSSIAIGVAGLITVLFAMFVG
ncbi:MAG: LrgB family protein [Oscillospiraceae bacterium]|nr:LrgB family protein [Oscillospiraceae bacterium]